MNILPMLLFLALAVTSAVSQSVSLPQALNASSKASAEAGVKDKAPEERLVRPAGFPSFNSAPAFQPEQVYLHQPYPGRLEPSISYRNADENDRFFNRKNWILLGINLAAQTAALLAIQSNGSGSKQWRQSQGRTLDPFEKHFESYGYGWGAAYRYGGMVGLNTLFSYMAHRRGRYKLERALQMFAIGHAVASTGYALAGSGQGHGSW